MVGRPRPDLISRCLPAPGSTDRPLFGLSTYEICTTTNQLRLDDGFKVSETFNTEQCLSDQAITELSQRTFLL